jgi:hypothetical protein
VTTTCEGVKITPGGAINGGTVALCNNFTTDNKVDLSCFVTDVSGTFNVKNGVVYQLCGPLATNLSGVAAKFAGNNSCAAPFSGADCVQIEGVGNPPAPFPPGSETDSAEILNCTTSSGPDSGPVIRLSAINGCVTANDGTQVCAPPASGCRVLVIDTAPNLNNIGLAACFPHGSLPPSC